MNFTNLMFFISLLFSSLSSHLVQARTFPISTIYSIGNPINDKAKSNDLATVEINLQGNGTDIACGSTEPLVADDTEFGPHNAGAANVVHTFTIQNTGDMDLNLVESPLVQISGSSDFTITAQPSTPIAAGSSTTFMVTFDPTTVGKQTATITITSDDTDEHFCTFLVKGNVSSACNADNGTWN